MDWLTPRAAYIHVPFCAHQCGYCDFAVSTDQSQRELYLEALAIEMQSEPVAVDTIFIGGGTPTSLDPDQLRRLLTAIRNRFPESTEFSIESTPDTVTRETATILAKHGVSRVSIGVQSFGNATLKSLDRRHGVEQIRHAIEAVKTVDLYLSLDLIFGAPGQSLSQWRRDLSIAIEHRPQHISTYGLTYEKGTPLWKARQRGELAATGEDLELAMYEAAIDDLTAAGFEHYEISNFARLEHRCVHNEVYWANHAYYGFGVGAARYINGERCVNVRDTTLYIRRMLADGDATQSREHLEPRERAIETMAIQLRRCDGIDRKNFAEQTGFDLHNLVGSAIDELTRQGLLSDGPSVALTRRGQCLADAVIERLMRAT